MRTANNELRVQDYIIIARSCFAIVMALLKFLKTGKGECFIDRSSVNGDRS